MTAILGSDFRRATRRVHIVGCERSGTTLLLEMMFAGFAFDARCEREQSLFDPPPTHAELFLSKKPLDLLRLERAFLADSQLFVLCTERDPRAVVTSRHAGRPDRYLSDFATWKACRRAARRLQNHERFLRVPYRDLVTDADRAQAGISERLPFLDRRASFSRFHETARPTETGVKALGGVRPPDPRGDLRWREDLPRIKSQLLQHPDLPRLLIEEGYERDEAWTALVAGVSPCPAPRESWTPVWLRDLERRARYAWKTRTYLSRLR